jgi:bacillithiol system protein YtxJ
MTGESIRFLDTEAALDEAMSLPLALLYKHSTRCGTSRRAMVEVERFACAQPEVPVFGIDVIRHRDISDRAAARLEVTHQSPQAVLLRSGIPVWTASHWRITAAVLAETVRRLAPD